MARPIAPLLPKHFSERRRNGLTKAIARGLGLPPEGHPAILRSISHRPTEAERRRFVELQARRDARAVELDMDPTLIASRAVLSELARDWENNRRALMIWQRELLSGP
jgi:ribonuclease D